MISTGPLPFELSKLENVQEVDLSSNRFTGNIFLQISSFTELRKINLSHNSLQGHLPDSLGDLINLESIDVSGNQLSGVMFSSTKSEAIRKTRTPELIHNFPRISYRELADATGGFDRQRLVGTGSFGRVYKGVLLDGTAIAVKALVLPYMANGSLDSRLYPHSGMVIDCDLKPSNVLLNDDMTALVSDFGIGRLVSTVGVVHNLGNSAANLLCGSIGYIAPVLEMVTRKRPTYDMFGVGISLHKWVKNHYHGRIEKVIDSSLMRSWREQSTEVKRLWDVATGELMELGILCTLESPSTRPTMLDCADDLDRLKRYLGGDTAATFASSLGISSSTLDDD
ncbi:hypothetical protein QYF36_010935 [Acer negundo]|nr:hypothetical protein QYF36_010935 [Acer negundo]